MRLSDFKSDPTGTMQVVSPGAGVIGTIEFAGPGHPLAVAQADRRYYLATHRTRVPSYDSATYQRVVDVVERILSWSFDEPFEKQEAKDLLRDPRMEWLLNQCTAFLDAPANFFQSRWTPAETQEPQE